MASPAATPVAPGFLSVLQRAGHEVEAVVTGVSMETSLSAGDRIRIRPASPANPPHRGDIAVHLSADGRLIVHRVVTLGRNWRGVPFLITRGDNQALCDMPVDVAEVPGTVSAVCRAGESIPPPHTPAAKWTANGRVVLMLIGAWARLTGPRQRAWLARRFAGSRRTRD